MKAKAGVTKYRKRSTKRKTISPKLEEKQKKVRDILKISVCCSFDYNLDQLSHQLKKLHFETDQSSLVFFNYFSLVFTDSGCCIY